ncbi:hypothetical protein L207DRAFT_477718 [Hyaloscypha variabilis F]|uniref:Heterokaryon incompatibility domain-containing protein n=1 Tax=Hyaloscypha variabilis (strain UAMH 11265 / GT02V1 / F) TaxID=1149755 RepID=A0A2J6SE27_HYAVF|nr:hypothetical protein L207DRAFT_477718 [Hyaloscypha variabilis F]
MNSDTNSPTPIDPQLTGNPAGLTAQSLTVLPTRRAHDDAEADDDDGERNMGSEKRQKLNLWKCKQCREARKKCFPADRVWPQKCNRCIAHRPEPLDCSEPELNNRKRGPNLNSKTRDKEKDNTTNKSPQPPKRTQTTALTSETQESPSRESTVDGEEGGSTDGTEIYERPKRTEVVASKGLKREFPGAPAPEPPKTSISKEDWRPSSCYQTLGEGEFRILKLAPGKKDDKNISCSFVIASVNKPMKYEAISYLWGVPNQKSMTINLADPHGKSHQIFIRSHLYEALKFLRHPSKTRSFWVDALCINYGSLDKAEKNSQTAMKRYVFRNAENLCFWLGEDEPSKTALRFVPQILDPLGIDKLVRDVAAVDNWLAFVTLLKNPVFGRLWLLQEVAVASNATLHSGPVSIHYQDLVDAVAIFKSFHKELHLLLRSTTSNRKDLFDRKITMAERFIEVSTNALRVTTTQDRAPRTQRLLSLEALVSYLSELKSTNPLDRIYSVLAIAKDGPKLDERTLTLDEHDDLRINYGARVVEVYQIFVIRAIDLSHSLDIICRHWASPDDTLPTWVSSLQFSQPEFDSIVSERTEADSLVGLPDHNTYHASRGTVATFRVFPTHETGMRRSLFARGMRLDTISRLAPRATEGLILYEWLELGGCQKHETKQGTVRYEVPESFWRTLVADRGPNGTMTPSWYSIAFGYCLLHLTPTGDINTNRLIRESEEESSLIVDFLQRVQSIIWNRKLLVSKENRWLGLAPTAAEEGDVICVLYGCSVPVLLRPVKEEERVVAWLLVGECYVHGIMDGEAIEAADMYREEEFELR